MVINRPCGLRCEHGTSLLASPTAMNLSPAQLLHFDGLIRQRRAALLDQLELHQGGLSRVDHARDLLDSDADDAAQHDAERDIDQALGERDGAELAALQQALSRLSAGRYGLCADCGDGIDLARLEHTPAALRCVACEARHEGRTPHATL